MMGRIERPARSTPPAAISIGQTHRHSSGHHYPPPPLPGQIADTNLSTPIGWTALLAKGHVYVHNLLGVFALCSCSSGNWIFFPFFHIFFSRFRFIFFTSHASTVFCRWSRRISSESAQSDIAAESTEVAGTRATDIFLTILDPLPNAWTVR